MKKWTVFCLLSVCLSAFAQTEASNDTERLRISKEKAALEAAFSRDEKACYKFFLVNNCLNAVKAKRVDALADLRRQEISINDQERKARGAEQIQKTEDRASLEKQQQEADRRAEALKDFEARMATEKQKNADRDKAESSEKANLEAANARIKSAQDKQAGQTAKQAAAAAEAKKYDEKIEKARDRQARVAMEKANQTKAPADPLPLPK